MNIPQEYTYSVQAACEQWTDQRVITDENLEDLLLFLLYVPKAASQFGVKIKGFSVRQKLGQTLLTVKALEGDTPLVVFVTSRTPIGCMHRFLSMLQDDRLVWVKDKYPWI